MSRRRPTTDGTDSPQYVTRPLAGGRSKYDWQPLIATATNGQALRVPLNGRAAANVSMAARVWASRRGYTLHARQQGGDTVLMWLEAKPEWKKT